MEANALIEIRMKYAEELEEILQCPVCYNRVKGCVPLCNQGHHVCHSCQPQLDNCPMCKSEYFGTRNYLAENLSGKLDEIKTSLLDPSHNINKKILKKCVETQTEDNLKSKALFPGKGNYPCCLGNCQEHLPHCRMIPHIRYYHEGSLVEGSNSFLENNCYKQTWKLTYEFEKNVHYAVNVPTMGIFFVLLNTDNIGDIRGNVFMVNTRNVAANIEYSLEIKVHQISVNCRQTVKSCRIEKEKLFDRCLYVNNSYMTYLLGKKKEFFFTLTLINNHSNEVKKITIENAKNIKKKKTGL